MRPWCDLGGAWHDSPAATHATGAQLVEEKEDYAEEHERADEDEAEVGGFRFTDAPEQHEGVGERSDQHRQDGLQEPIAVDQSHVPSRELARRGLHQENRHGDDEADQPDHRSENGRENR